MTSVVVASVAIILIKIVIEIWDNKGDLFVALVAIILIKNDKEMLKVKDSLFQWNSLLYRTSMYLYNYVAVYFLFQLIFVFPLF